VSRIFLSHSSGNNAEAIAIRDWMVAQGWNDVFLDLDPERGLKAGERWQEALKRAADRCETVIFLISPEWVESKWCLAELLLAKNLNKRIFPVIVKPTPLSALPTELTAEWQVIDLTVESHDYSVAGKTTTIAFGSGGLNRLRIGLIQAGIDAKHFAWPPAKDPNRPPYRGLKWLEEDDAGIFFGRDAPVIAVLDQLRGLRDAAPPCLLVILGASGAGKSSFLRAGLLPRLARDDRHFFALPIIRPERVAISGETGLLRALEGAFWAAKLPVSRADLRAAINGGATQLRALLSTLAQKATPAAAYATVTLKPPTLVLSIDQSEELFQVEGQQEAQLFLALLRDLVTANPPAVIALFTIRSDKYERLQEAKELDGVPQLTFSLPPMPRGSCAEVIKGPARLLEGTPRALKIDDALVDALLLDIEAGAAKDALPLLAFTLERLYGEYGANGHLTLENYKKLGRIEGSIEAAVEHALRAADAHPKVPKDKQERLALLRRGLIPWLAGIDPDTGTPRRRVARLSEIPAEALPLIDLLVEQRLLSTDIAEDTKEKTIEPAHEALLRRWGVLHGWLKEDTRLLTVLDGIKRGARDWVANGKVTSYLAHAKEPLRAAERLLQHPSLAAFLEPTEKEYVASCRRAERAADARVRRMLAAVGVLAFGVVAGLGGWWKQDFFREQYNWHVAMGPTVLTGKGEQDKATQPGSEFKDCAHGCPMMVVVQPGEFMMGSPESEKDRYEREGPQHKVTILTPMAVGKTEVTFDEWGACVAAHACKDNTSDSKSDRGDRPVINVSWDDAQRYVAWLSRITGKDYRLLSEAEWEYAARAGGQGRFSFGDDEARLDQYAWYVNNSDDTTHQVGLRPPNAFGLHDMHGNVWEWVEDQWHQTYKGAPTDGKPWVRDGEPGLRVVRGGSFSDDPGDLRAAVRFKYGHDIQSDSIGFRLARKLTP
jgi:formylglycine-generating enzyme required for sulfatase activity